MYFTVLGCMAAVEGDYNLWRYGNPHGYYFLGYKTADPNSDVWQSMYGYDLLFDQYILMQYTGQIAVGYDAYLAVEQSIDLSRYAGIEVVVENTTGHNISVELGSVSGAELGTGSLSWTRYGSGTTVSGNSTQTITIDISSVTATLQPAIHIHTSNDGEPNAKIYSWRLIP